MLMLFWRISLIYLILARQLVANLALVFATSAPTPQLEHCTGILAYHRKTRPPYLILLVDLLGSSTEDPHNHFTSCPASFMASGFASESEYTEDGAPKRLKGLKEAQLESETEFIQ